MAKAPSKAEAANPFGVPKTPKSGAFKQKVNSRTTNWAAKKAVNRATTRRAPQIKVG